METKAEWLAQLEEIHDSWNWCRHELIHEPTLNLEREKNSTRHRRGKQSINQSVNYRHEPTAVSIVQRRHAFNETFMIREKCHLVVSLGTFCYFLLSAFSMPPLEHSVVDLVKLNLLLLFVSISLLGYIQPIFSNVITQIFINKNLTNLLCVFRKIVVIKIRISK